MNFSDFTLRDLVRGIKDGTFTAKEVQEYFIQKTEEQNPDLNAFLTIHTETEEIASELPLA